MKENSGEVATSVSDWDPRRYLRKGDSATVRLSRGFLRCRAEKWFPGFGSLWLPFVHSLGVDVKLVEVRAYQAAPKGLDVGFAGTVDEEPIGMVMDNDSAKIILEAVTPGAFENARSVMLEYLARRYLSSLAQSWSGPESSLVRFDANLSPFDIREAGAVKFAFTVNGAPCTLWLLLGRALMERLDGLWRRQVRSTSRLGNEPQRLHIEATQLMVPPALLSQYTKSGTVVDLETVISDQVLLRLNDRPWLPARLMELGGNLGFEVLAGITPTSAQPDATTRLSIEFGSMMLDAGALAEIGQIGAMYESDIPVSNRVDMIINGQKAAEATLCTYDGRFAITVL